MRLVTHSLAPDPEEHVMGPPWEVKGLLTEMKVWWHHPRKARWMSPRVRRRSFRSSGEERGVGGMDINSSQRPPLGGEGQHNPMTPEAPIGRGGTAQPNDPRGPGR